MKKKACACYSGFVGGVAAFLLMALLSGCDRGPQSALVWTDVPELVVAAQLFNKENEEFAIDVEYKADVASEIKKTSQPPSLVIGKYLLSKPLMKKFDPMDDLFSKYYLDPNDIYPALLDAGKQGTSHILIPISFDCMVLVERKSGTASAGIAVLDYDALQRASRAFTTIKNDKAEELGFSSRWNMEFAEDWLLADGVGFSLNQNWKPNVAPKAEDLNSWPILWDKNNLERSISTLLSFNSNVTEEQEEAFSFTYFNKPGYQLVLDNRVLYWPMKASEFFSLPYSAKARLRYRFPSVNQKILLTADTRYMGIPKGAKNKKAAMAFARWLLIAGNQEKIWKEMQSEHLLPDYIGPFGGLSSLIQINEAVFSKYFPEYSQNPILSSGLSAVPALPEYWDAFSKDFLRHWLEGALSTVPTKSSVDEDFRASLEKYLGTMPDWLNGNR